MPKRTNRQDMEQQARANLMTAIDEHPTETDTIASYLDAYIIHVESRCEREAEDDLESAKSASYEHGNEDGYERGHAEALGDISVGGQTRLNVLATLRKLDSEARCPFESRAWLAMADAVEGA